MGRPVHKYKEKNNNKGDFKMKKNTIRNIIFAILGAFLFGLGVDLNTWSIGTIGFISMFISMCLAATDSGNK